MGTEAKRRWRWSNVPIPEVFLAVLVLGTVAKLFVPLAVLPEAWMGHAMGWPLLLAGVILAGWAVLAAGDRDIARPNEIVVSGPYRFSRNPMYLGWALITLGLGLVLNSVPVLMLLPLAVLFLHLVEVPREERSLERRVGEDYLAYKGKVRRWL